MSDRASALVSVLFTDLVNSTKLLARTGDEDAQRTRRAHHHPLAATAAAHGGEEVTGPGVMAAFPSAATLEARGRPRARTL
jgi:adenylate cyclase